MAKKIPLEDVTDVLDAADAEYKNNQHSTEETLAVLDEAEDPYKLKIPKMAPRNALKDTGGTPSLSLLDVSKATNAALDDKPMPQLGRAVDNLSLATDALAKRRGGKAAMGLDDKGNAVELTEKDKYKELNPEEIAHKKVLKQIAEKKAAKAAKSEALPDNPAERAKATHTQRAIKLNDQLDQYALGKDGSPRDPEGIDPETNQKYTPQKKRRIIFSQSAKETIEGFTNPETGEPLKVTDLSEPELRALQRGAMSAPQDAFGMKNHNLEIEKLGGIAVKRINDGLTSRKEEDLATAQKTRDVQRKAEQLAVTATENQVDGQAKVEAYRANPDDPKVEADYLNWQSTELELLENADPKKEDYSQDLARGERAIQASMEFADRLRGEKAKALEGLDKIDNMEEIATISKAYDDRINIFDNRAKEFKEARTNLENLAKEPKSTVIKGKEKDALARADAKERANDPSRAKLQKSMPLPDVPAPTEKAKEVAGPDTTKVGAMSKESVQKLLKSGSIATQKAGELTSYPEDVIAGSGKFSDDKAKKAFVKKSIAEARSKQKSVIDKISKERESFVKEGLKVPAKIQRQWEQAMEIYNWLGFKRKK